MSTPSFWRVENVTMRFPGVVALKNVSLDIHKGEILGLLGENGSGKSTLIKCLSGINHPQEGTFFKDGKEVKLSSSQEARKNGVATVYQEFSLVQSLSVTENMFLGNLDHNALGQVNWKSMREKVKETLQMLEIDIDPDKIVSDLSVAEQQMVEIAKGFTTGGSLMILDEPTTALVEREVVRLHALLRRLASEGETIIYITHRLDEVLEIADRAVVLRNGVLVKTLDKAEMSFDAIVEAMSGKVISEHYPKEHNAQDEIVLNVENISSTGGVKNVTFNIRKGEVLGLAGLMGSGRTEIARALFGVDKLTEGTVELNGKRLEKMNPQKACENGIAFLTENRKTNGLFFNFEGPRNTTSASLRKLMRRMTFGKLSMRKERDAFKDAIHQLEIIPSAAHKLVGFLSGGNQQKVVISRWMFAEAELFIFDEPTQGIDVGARLQVYKIINDLTRAGKSILLISSDDLELFAMSDRIATVKDGTVHRVIDAKDAEKSIMFDG